MGKRELDFDIMSLFADDIASFKYGTKLFVKLHSNFMNAAMQCISECFRKSLQHVFICL